MERHRVTYPCGTPRRRRWCRRAGSSCRACWSGAAAAGCATKTGDDVEPPTDAARGPTRPPTDRVTIGSTGIVTSRLALGSGTHGFNGSSDQTRLGMTAFVNQLTYGYSKGVTFFETAADYGAHPFIAEAVRQVGPRRTSSC